MNNYKQFIITQKQDELLKRCEQIAKFSVTINADDISFGRRMQMIRLVDELTDSIVWVVDKKGMVIFDSNDDFRFMRAMIDISDIKKGDKITTQDFTSYFKQNTLTVAVPIYNFNEVVGAIYLHTSIDDVYRTYQEYKYYLINILLFSIFLSVILGALYSMFFTKNIEKMKKTVDEISKGNYKVRTNVTSNDEVGELARTLDKMTGDIDTQIEEIKRLSQMSKDLVANVSHEFKTPLTLIRGYIENIKDNTVEASEKIYDRILDNTSSLEKMVNEVLDLSKLESGKVEINREEFELDEMIKNIIKEMSLIAIKRNIKIHLDINDDPVILEADYIKIKQVLIIFIDNAIKYSKEDGVVNINLKADCIEIVDEGIGIKAEILPHIFERFYQAELSRSGKGYGLGLCIAKHILDMHQFDMNIESEENKGTKITILLKN
ncbi:MAG: hypothetical protein A2Y18_02270 [Clostridiales bacterium GWD2_32_19]|nr:MAG: hypothetical protein A2Y18_02270 [Clostridiales bacterium GWD2_32_19]